jgi:hypothetical protein
MQNQICYYIHIYTNAIMPFYHHYYYHAVIHAIIFNISYFTYPGY